MTVPDDIKAWRKAQRAELLSKREAAPLAVRRGWNDRVTRLLIEGFSVLERCTVGFCWPFKGEADARFFIRHLRQHGATAALPAVVEKNAPLQFLEWWPGVETRIGVFDLPVPRSTRTLHPDALLIPPVGFDAHGYRLGYGGGYFDRTLAARMPHPIKIAVAFEVSRMTTIYPQAHDIPMDFIVTEDAIHCVTDRGLRRIEEPDSVPTHVTKLLRERGLPRSA